MEPRNQTPQAEPSVPRDRQMVQTLWPLLLAAALGLVPFTLFSTFLVPIARDAGAAADVIGGIRGLGGLAALAVGALAAPIIDRLSRAHLAGGALLLLAVGCLVALVSTTATWILFSLLIGAGTSVLNPALSVMAADNYTNPAASGRAATLVSSTTTLAAVASAPLLAAPALWWGWRGDLILTALVCVVVAALLMRISAPKATTASVVAYGESFRTVLRLPSVPGLLLISMLRTTAFMGQLAYVAAYFGERYGLSAATFTLVWTLSGLTFFLGNWWAGRHLSRGGDSARLLIAGSILAALGAGALFAALPLFVALASVSVVAAGHAVIAASVVTLVVRRSGDVKGTAMSLNASGQSLGVFAGAALVGLALGLGGWLAVGLALVSLMIVSLLLALWVQRVPGSAEASA